jgi:hypothetical protein
MDSYPLLRKLGGLLKYEVTEESPLPVPFSESFVSEMPRSEARYREVALPGDQYTCPVCLCPARCSIFSIILDPHSKHSPRLYKYHCLSGHTYVIRFNYNVMLDAYKDSGSAWIQEESHTT